MLMKITFGELSKRWGMSDEACNILNLNPYCLNTGLATLDDTIPLTHEQARQLGITSDEFLDRAKTEESLSH